MRGVGARHAAPLLGVDLSPLQLSREVYVDDLRLRVEVVHLPAALAVPVAGLLHSAERQVRFSADGGRVDVGDPGVQLVHRAERGVHVPRVQRAKKPVLHAVDRKSTRLNSSHGYISYAVFCLEKKKKNEACEL